MDKLTLESAIPPLISTDPRVTVGRFTYGSPALKLWSDDESVSIGAFCSIAEEVVILGGGEHRMDWVTTFPLRIAFADPLSGRDGHPANKGPTVIGNDVWISYGATILSGVRVGHGAVIGARAVVTRDVPDYAVVAGNPAQVVKMRFTPSQIERLLAVSWWDWSIEKIFEHTHALCNTDIAGFIASACSGHGAAPR